MTNQPAQNSNTGVIAREEHAALEAIRAALTSEGVDLGTSPLD